MANRPNLLYIHSDQHNAQVLGCAGDPLVETPNLDRLAAGGALFSNVYCTSPICVPSRMSMLTGRHPYQNQVWTNNHLLDSGIPTLAHSMGAAGYHPVLIGRMHSIGPDQLHGYAERQVGDHSGNFLGGAPVDRGVLDGTAGPERVSLERSGAGQSAYQVHDEDVAAAAVNTLNRLGVQKRAFGEIEPFSLSVGFMLPHPPYVARCEDYERYAEQMTMPTRPERHEQVQHPYIRRWREYTGIVEVSESEVCRARAAYWGLVHRVDELVGQVLAALVENGLAENTLIVYTSDHGDMQGEHGLWWKHVFYEESVRVPLIVHWPGVIPAGQRCDRVVSALDVTATMLDALQAPALPGSPGRSFLGLVSVARPTPDWEDVAFSEYVADQYTPDGESYHRMVRQGAWKLVYYEGMEPQLFNLAEDPGEMQDRAADPSCRQIRAELTERVLADWSPTAIAPLLAQKRAETAILRQWANQTRPTEQYRWPLSPAMNRLDDWPQAPDS
ncbi:MAG: sulfatase-like hydrolase/transferase [Caldilineaceae bacterium]|nr:sulfatase-like hydrolase/transferase [Caldilineaceae bacterium]